MEGKCLKVRVVSRVSILSAQTLSKVIKPLRIETFFISTSVNNFCTERVVSFQINHAPPICTRGMSQREFWFNIFYNAVVSKQKSIITGLQSEWVRERDLMHCFIIAGFNVITSHCKHIWEGWGFIVILLNEVSKTKHVPRSYKHKSLNFLMLLLLSSPLHQIVCCIITIDYVVVYFCVFYDKEQFRL